MKWVCNVFRYDRKLAHQYISFNYNTAFVRGSVSSLSIFLSLQWQQDTILITIIHNVGYIHSNRNPHKCEEKEETKQENMGIKWNSKPVSSYCWWCPPVPLDLLVNCPCLSHEVLMSFQTWRFQLCRII